MSRQNVEAGTDVMIKIFSPIKLPKIGDFDSKQSYGNYAKIGS
jgi:hypothetical protein